jgi:hypothetical protein
MLDKFDAKTLNEMQTRFEAEILTAMANRVQFKLNGPTNLTVKFRGGATREYPFTGGEVFNLAAATPRVQKDFMGDDVHELILRLMPAERQEYHYIELLKANLQTAFTARFRDATTGWQEWRTFNGLWGRMLEERDDKVGMTFNEMLNKVLDAERQKLAAQGLENHKDFGSW